MPTNFANVIYLEQKVSWWRSILECSININNKTSHHPPSTMTKLPTMTLPAFICLVAQHFHQAFEEGRFEEYMEHAVNVFQTIWPDNREDTARVSSSGTI